VKPIRQLEAADMTSTTTHDVLVAQRATRQDRIRQVTVISSAVFAVIASFIGSGAAGGTPIQDAVGGALSADATLLSPDQPAFLIWTTIYAGLLAYAVWQALPTPATAPRQRRLGYWIAASMVLNGVWILMVQWGQLLISCFVIAGLLAVLAVIFVKLVDSRPSGLIETIVLDGTMGLYFGWVTIATVANVTALLVVIGFTGFQTPEHWWSIGMIIVAGLIGIGVAIRGRGRLTPALALSWGLFWIAISRFTGTLHSTPTAIAALIVGIIVVLAACGIRLWSDSRGLPAD
jgi:hypothetical protein